MFTALMGILDNLWFGGNLSGWYYPLLVFTDLVIIARLESCKGILSSYKESAK